MTEYTQTLARATKADLGFEDHDIFGFNIEFRLSESGYQASGWRFLSNPGGGPLLEAVLNVFNARRWSGIVGTTIYVLYDPADGYNGFIKGFEALPFDGGARLVFEEFYEVGGY